MVGFHSPCDLLSSFGSVFSSLPMRFEAPLAPLKVTLMSRVSAPFIYFFHVDPVIF